MMKNLHPLRIWGDINDKHVNITFDLSVSISYLFLKNNKVLHFEISVCFTILIFTTFVIINIFNG